MKVAKKSHVAYFTIALLLLLMCLIPLDLDGAAANTFGRSKTLDDFTVSTTDDEPFPSRQLQNTPLQECTALPMENIQATWEWTRSPFNTAPATGMVVVQNGVTVFEEYAPSNVCPLLCIFPPFRVLWNVFFRFGGSPTAKFSMNSMTKSFAGLAALLLVKKGYVTSLDDKVSTYVSEWAGVADKQDVTIRELLTLSSGIFSQFLPGVLFTALNGPFVGKVWQYGFEPFGVFSYLVGIVTGKTGLQFLKDELFGPLGMSSVHINALPLSGVTEFYAGGFISMSDLVALGEELMAASLGEGTVFDENDMKELTTYGLAEGYGLSWVLNSDSIIAVQYPDCGVTDVFHMVGAGEQYLTIVPKKRLVIAKSSFFMVSNFLSVQFWRRIFDGVPCECQYN